MSTIHSGLSGNVYPLSHSIYKSSSGNLYAVYVNGSTLYIRKSTDAGGSWSANGSHNPCTGTQTLCGGAACPDGDTLHIAVVTTGLATGNNETLYYYAFSMSSDSFTTTAEAASNFEDGTQTAGVGGIAVRSDGDIIIAFTGVTLNMTTYFRDVQHVRREGTTWTTVTNDDGQAGNSYQAYGGVLGGGDRFHWLGVRHAALRVAAYQLLANNTFSRSTSVGPSYAAPSYGDWGVGYARYQGTYIRYVGAIAGQLDDSSFSQNAFYSEQANDTHSPPTFVAITAYTAEAERCTCTNNGSTVYVVGYGNDSGTKKLWFKTSTDGGATWGSVTDMVSGTTMVYPAAAFIDFGGGHTGLAYTYTDGSGAVIYGEHELTPPAGTNVTVSGNSTTASTTPPTVQLNTSPVVSGNSATVSTQNITVLPSLDVYLSGLSSSINSTLPNITANGSVTLSGNVSAVTLNNISTATIQNVTINVSGLVASFNTTFPNTSSEPIVTVTGNLATVSTNVPTVLPSIDISLSGANASISSTAPNITANGSVTLTGVNSSINTSTPSTISGTDVSVNVSGLASIVSTSNVVLQSSPIATVSGNFATISTYIPTVLPTIDVSLSGAGSSISVRTPNITADGSVTLSGASSSITTSPVSIDTADSVSVSVSGLSVIINTVLPSITANGSAAVLGNQVSVSTYLPTVFPSVSPVVTGVALVISSTLPNITASGSVTLTGVNSTANAGTVSLVAGTGNSVTVSGVAATTNKDNVSIQASPNASVSGVLSTFSTYIPTINTQCFVSVSGIAVGAYLSVSTVETIKSVQVGSKEITASSGTVLIHHDNTVNVSGNESAISTTEVSVNIASYDSVFINVEGIEISSYLGTATFGEEARVQGVILLVDINQLRKVLDLKQRKRAYIIG